MKRKRSCDVHLVNRVMGQDRKLSGCEVEEDMLCTEATRGFGTVDPDQVATDKQTYFHSSVGLMVI